MPSKNHNAKDLLAMKKFIAILTVFVIGVSGAYAQHRDHRGPKRAQQGFHQRPQSYAINDLQRDVRSRIEFGLANGFLSRREGKKLMKEYNHIAERESAYRRRGGLTHSESRDLIVSLENLKRRVPFEVRERSRDRKDWARRY